MITKTTQNITTTADILQSIETRGYAATDNEVIALAGGVAQGIAATGTYLRVLVAAVLARLGGAGRRRRMSPRVDVLGALEAEHARLYQLVLVGVGPTDLDMQERNRRATFARTAASTVRAFIKADGDVTALVPAEVTKNQLRKAIAPPEAGDRITRRANRAFDSLLRAVTRYIEHDPDTAATFIENCIQSLEEHLQEQEPGGAEQHGTTTVIATPQGPRRQPTVLHRGAS